MFRYDVQLALERHQELLRQAEQERRARLTSRYEPGPTTRLMAWAGRRLVAVGQELQVRAVAPVVVTDSCV